MKISFILAVSAIVGLVSCNKTGVISDREESLLVAFSLGGPAFTADVVTKAAAVTQDNLNAFNVAAATGTAGSADVNVWNCAFTKTGSVFTSDKVWPNTNPGYHFYASNAALTLGASGATVAATDATDVVCAYLPAGEVGYKSTNTLSFEHIFARVGETTVNASAGYTLSGVSITLVPRTGGTYNLFSGAGKTDGTGWSSVSNGSATGIANATGGTKANDIYLVPGTYELTASWTATKGDYTQTFTDRKKSVTIVGGKVNKISTTLGGGAEDIIFSISVSEWGENNIPVNFDI